MGKPDVKFSIPCPFCGGDARGKACAEKPGRPIKFYWRCLCDANGFFTEAHFKALDKAKKISFAS